MLPSSGIILSLSLLADFVFEFTFMLEKEYEALASSFICCNGYVAKAMQIVGAFEVPAEVS